MIISNVRYAFTRNLGNYESVKVEVEAAPSEDQNPETLISELRGYVEANLPGAVNTVEVTIKAKDEEPVRKSNPRTKKAAATKAPESVADAIAMTPNLGGVQLATFFNACRDSALANYEGFPELCKAVAERCQATCEIGSPERAAISAALKAEKLRRENA